MNSTIQPSKIRAQEFSGDDALMKLVVDKVFREYNGNFWAYWEAIRPKVASERFEDRVAVAVAANLAHRSYRK